MKVLLIVLVLLQGAWAASITAGGHINADATWNTDTVLVTDTFTVDSGVTLTVTPGTRVEFQGYYKFKVRGRVLAQGLQTDSIVFTAKDTSAGWRGIRYESISAANDTSRFSYCRIEYGRIASGAGQEFWGAGVFLETPCKVRIENCLIRRNSGESYGGGLYVSSSAVVLLNNTIRENRAATGAGICLNGGSATLAGNTIAANNASATGGGITSRYSSPRFINNIIAGNNAVNGGGLHCSLSPVKLMNSLICNNSASMGGGVFCPDSPLVLINCTVANNRAANNAGGMYASTVNTAASPVLINAIFWGNTASSVPNQLSLNNPTVRPEIRCCDLQGGLSAVTGNGVPRVYRDNLDLNPLFGDSAAGDYAPGAGSPCVNAGTPDTAGLGLPAQDLAGHARIYAGAVSRVDVGAYEAQADPAGGITVTFPAGGDSLAVGASCRITWASTGTVGNVRIQFCVDSGRTWQDIVASALNTGAFDWTVPDAVSPGCVVRISGASAGTPFDESDGLFAIYDPTRLCGWITRDTVWDADTVKVGCPVYVDTGVTLTISPGTRVEFLGPFPLKVRGRVLAQGLVSDSIVFIARDISAGWRGIRFDSLSAAVSDTSRFSYCRIQYARASGSGLDGYGGGIFINGFGKVIIENSTLSNNTAINGGAGICFWLGSGVIRNNTIQNNASTHTTFSFGAGIFCQSSSPLIAGNIIRNNNSSREGGGISCQGSSPVIMNNLIMNNIAGNEGGGIRCNESSSPLIVGNVIRGNQAYDGGGVFSNRSALKICNSTIVNNRGTNGGGLRSEEATPSVKNTILWGNTGGQIVLGYLGGASVEYSDVQGGRTGTGNIDSYPLFVDSGNGNFQLADGSPCVNTGTPDTAGLSLPPYDMAGNVRVFGGRVDMGAYESLVPMGVETGIPAEFSIAQNSPNPFNPVTRIRIGIPAAGGKVPASLRIYDTGGRLVKKLHAGDLAPGFHGFEWDGLDDGRKPAASGFYLIKLHAGAFQRMIRCMLMK